MATAHTKIFKSNRSQAVRLNKEVALPDSVVEVDIVAIGNKRIITPSGESGDDWFDGDAVTTDFMKERCPRIDIRDQFYSDPKYICRDDG